MNKPVLGPKPKSQTPVLSSQPSSRRPALSGPPVSASKPWCFGFRYWSEHQNFGFQFSGKRQADHKWFVSLLGRLRELGKVDDPETYLKDRANANNLRYHEIDWAGRNVPLTRADCTWVPNTYLDDEANYPFLQFHVSQALGRVVGFWDEQRVFQIVLLDPLHNIQPSKDYGYAVDACGPLGCSYTSLMADVDAAIAKLTCGHECDGRRRLALLSSHSVQDQQHVLLVALDDDVRGEALKLVTSGHAQGLRDIFLRGVCAIMDDVAMDQRAQIEQAAQEALPPRPTSVYEQDDNGGPQT